MLHRPSLILRYGCVPLSIALAIALGNQLPYPALFFVVLLTALVPGGFNSTYFLLQPWGIFRLDGLAQYAGIGLYLAIGLTIAVLGGAMLSILSKMRRVEARAVAAQRQASLLDQIHDAVLAWEWNGPITYWNRGAERLYGYLRPQALARVSHDLLGTQTLDGLQEIIRSLERDGSWEGELEQTTQAGEKVIVESRMVLVREAEHAYVLEANRDITPRKRAEAELRQAKEQLETRVQERTRELVRANESLEEHEQRLRLLVTGVKDYAMFMLDPQGNVATWNQGAERIKGYRTEEIVGLHFSRFYPPVEIENGKPERELRTAAAEGSYQEEGWRLRKDGSRFWANVLITAMRDGHGQLRGFSKVTRDMTEPRREEAALRETQARMSGIINSAMDAIISINDEQNIVLFNAAAEKMFQCTAVEALGQPITMFLPARFRERHHQHVRGFGTTGVTSRSMRSLGVLSGLRAGGEEFPIEASISQLDLEGQKQYTVILRDITERKRAEEALVESRARMEGLINSAMDAIISINDQQCIVLFNAAAEKMFRCPASTALGQSIEIFVPAHFRQQHNQHVRGFGATGVTSRSMRSLGALSGLRADGEEFPIEASISQLDVGGQKQYTVILRDITERKRAEEALVESRARMEGLINSAMDAIISINDRQCIVLFNAAAEKMFQYTAAEALGQSIVMFLPARFREHHHQHVRGFGTTGVTSRSMRSLGVLSGLRADGEEFPIEASISQLDVEGQKQYTVILRDITERKRAEESLRKSEAQLQTVVESLDEGVVISDLTGKLVHFNRAALAMHGFASMEECLRREPDFADAFELRRMDGSLWALDQWPVSRILRGEKLRDMEVRIRRLQGGWERVFNYGGTLVLDANGKPLMAVVTIADITERKRAADEIRQLNTELELRVVERTVQLEAANKELEAFSYSVSHDLRSPLRAVDGFSQALLEDYGPQLPDQGRHYLNTIRAGAQRMGQLIDDLLTFARLSRQPLKKRKVDTSRLVRETLEELANQREGRRIDVQIGELASCQGDWALLKQVWVNLLSNAQKYTRQRNPAVIEIGCTCAQGEPGVYFVRDNGTGFDMKYTHRLFGVFQRLHRAEDFEGTGVGLAIVQRIVQRHGGRIWADAAVDKGATFYFTVEGENKI